MPAVGPRCHFWPGCLGKNMRVVQHTEFQPVWRCLRTKTKSEHLAAQHLRAAGFEAFSPRVRHQKPTIRGRVWFVEALFPGYLFSLFPAASLRHVSSLPYVAGLLEFCEDFGRVPDEVISGLRAQFSDAETVTVPCAFAEGETVAVGDGPLRGAEGVITKLLPGKDRARILLEFLGRQQEMEVSLLALLGFRDPRREALQLPA